MEICAENLNIIMPIVLILLMLPFFVIFERSKPRPKDLVPIAVMSALGALGRALFAAIPNFKPTTAIVMITGMQFGPLAGFLTGALSALVSNLFLGQGPWTLWQMSAWGMIGFVSGIFQKRGLFQYRTVLYLFGMISGILFGWILNLQYILGYVDHLNVETVAACYAASIWFDVTHGISTVVFLAILERPWGRKLHRLKAKYGILEKESE